jgi:hypothetical protein
MEYRDREREQYGKVNRRLKRLWIIISSVIAGVVLLILFLSYIVVISQTHNAITKSTRARKPIPVDERLLARLNAGRVVLFTDNTERQEVNYPDRWNIAVIKFYEETGVLLHYRTEDDGEWLTLEKLEEAYREAFDDPEMSGPFMLIMSAKPRGYSEYAYISGDEATLFVDREAAQILLDCIRNPWRFTGGNYNDYYKNALNYAANRMMTVSISPAVWPTVALFLVIIPGVIVFFIIRRRRFKKDEEIHAILNTELDEIAVKYTKDE